MAKEHDSKPLDIDFYYADLQLTVTVKADKGDAFAELTNNQRIVLQQIIYQSLNTFLYTRALYLSDNQT